MTAVPHVAIELAKRFEGFCRVPRNDPGRAYPYICPAGFWTIGYGHLCDQSHPPITAVEGEAYLAQDMQVALKQPYVIALCWRRSPLVVWAQSSTSPLTLARGGYRRRR
jgi:GH24 family phage-related lysozyme (muramidase)